MFYNMIRMILEMRMIMRLSPSRLKDNSKISEEARNKYEVMRELDCLFPLVKSKVYVIHVSENFMEICL